MATQNYQLRIRGQKLTDHFDKVDVARLRGALSSSTAELFGVALATVVGIIDIVLAAANIWHHGDDTVQGTLWHGGGDLLHLGLVLFDGHLGVVVHEGFQWSSPLHLHLRFQSCHLSHLHLVHFRCGSWTSHDDCKIQESVAYSE